MEKNNTSKKGRKKKEYSRDIRRLYRFNEYEYNILKKAVELTGKLESEFVRDAILKEAQRILK
jgi:uncharacterized protein (DUF1778 family)